FVISATEERRPVEIACCVEGQVAQAVFAIIVADKVVQHRLSPHVALVRRRAEAEHCAISRSAFVECRAIEVAVMVENQASIGKSTVASTGKAVKLSFRPGTVDVVGEFVDYAAAAVAGTTAATGGCSVEIAGMI